MSKITIEELARMSQDEFTSVRGEIKDLRTEMRDGFEKGDKKFDEVSENLG